MWLKNIKVSDQCLYIAYMMAIAIIFYILNVCTPCYWDDWSYYFKFDTTEPIQNISDVLESQYTHYVKYNGRSVVHCIVQTFDGIIGKELFNIANTIVFVCFLHLICLIALDKSSKPYFPMAVLVTLAVFVFFPGFRECFLWMSGACNYLWSAFFLLLFHYFLQKESFPSYGLPFCLLYGIWCGWTHEGIVLGLAAGYFVHYLTHRDKWMGALHRRYLLAGLCIGIAFLVFSPGSIHRALGNGEHTTSIITLLCGYLATLLQMGQLRLLPLLLVALSLLYCRHRLKPHFLKEHLIWVIAIAVNFFFIFLMKCMYERALFGIELFALILLLTLLSSFKFSRGYMVALAVALIVYMGDKVVPYCWHQHYINESFFQSVASSKDGIVYYHPKSEEQHRFIVSLPTDDKGFLYDYWQNEVLANYYGKEKLILMPSSVQSCGKEQLLPYEVLDDPSLPFYICAFDGDPQKVLFQLHPTDYRSLPFYIRPFAPHLARYAASEVDASTYAVVYIDGAEYLFIGKNSVVDHRLKEIEVQTSDHTYRLKWRKPQKGSLSL